VAFLWNRIIKKFKWEELRLVLRQPFVSLSDLVTDSQRLLHCLFPAKNNDSVTIILRGLPGSGKSHFANNVLAPHLGCRSVEIFSADDLFLRGGEYKFDEELLAEAHVDCRERFEKSTAAIRIVDNTNSTLAEYKFYKRKSRQRCVVLEIHGHGPAKRNGHDVPQWIVDRMVRRWETDSEAIRVHNFRS